jgi:hypothetical protein
MIKNMVRFAGVSGLLMLALATPSFAAGTKEPVTITGEGKCGKCAMKVTEKCQNVIQVDKDGKKVDYYLTDNKVSKAFHETICKESKKVTATGKVKEVDGKMQLTATKIEEVK